MHNPGNVVSPLVYSIVDVQLQSIAMGFRFLLLNLIEIVNLLKTRQKLLGDDLRPTADEIRVSFLTSNGLARLVGQLGVEKT